MEWTVERALAYSIQRSFHDERLLVLAIACIIGRCI
jgi:hypothetical protein